MSLSSYITWTKQHNANTLDVESTQDSRFILADGRQIDDFISTSFQASFGHSQEKILVPIEQWLRKMPIASPKSVYPFKEAQTQRLLKYLKLDGGKIFYTVSGAEAVENALKMVRQISGKKKILARQKSYHGASLGALSITGDWRCHAHFTVDEWTLRIPEPQEDLKLEKTRQLIETAGPENIAGFCLETISGTNGVIIPPEQWWRGIESLCEEFNLYLILDEVLTGFRRTGENFAFHHFHLKPDLVVMSKAITGGYIPFGAVWTSDEFSCYYENETLSCGLTNYAHPLGLAAMSGVLDLLEDANFMLQTQKLEKEFSVQLENLHQLDQVREVRARGLLAALELNTQNLEKKNSEFLDAGLHLFAKGSQIILAPPLTMPPDNLKNGMARLQKVLSEE